MSEFCDTYYLFDEKKGVQTLNQMPDIHTVAVDTYVLAQFPDGAISLYRSEFHMGRGGKNPWSFVNLDDHDIPDYVKAWLLLMDIK